MLRYTEKCGKSENSHWRARDLCLIEKKNLPSSIPIFTAKVTNYSLI